MEYNNSTIEIDKRIYNSHRINELKHLLADTDYRAIKYSEGYYTEEEYAPYKALRQSYRDEINQLELELSQLDQSSTNEN